MSKDSLTFKKFEIYSNDDESSSVDLRGGTPRIEYRESVFLPYVVVVCNIVDTGNAVLVDDRYVSVLEAIKCQGVEKVDFAIEDSLGNKINLDGDDYHLRVAATSEISTSFKATTFKLSLVSSEAFDNLPTENECRNAYGGKISDIVKSIIKNNLKSTKETTNFDVTLDTFNQQGKSRKPFDMILDLQKICIPESVQTDKGKTSKGHLAGYLFWQTSEGWNFKSLDNLFKFSGSYLKYIDNRGRAIKNYIETKRADNNIPSGFTDKILHYRVHRTIDALRQFETGAFGTLLETWDPINCRYDKTNSVITTEEGNGIRAGKNLPNFGKYAGKATKRIANKSKAKGQTVVYGDNIEQQVEKTDKENYSVDDVTQQALQNYKQKMNMSAEIVIPADFSLHAGDLIYCEFQELSSGKTIRSSNNRDSGIYMIADLCHFGNRSKTFTGLHLVRDSYGVKNG